MITRQGYALADAHRVRQGQLAALTAAQVVALWPLLLAGGRIDENSPTWLRAVVAVLAMRKAQSAALAAQFLTAYRMVESGVVEPFTPDLSMDLDMAAVTTSLMVTGPQELKRQVAARTGKKIFELTPEDLRTTSPGNGVATHAARAGIRIAQSGARETFDNAINNDRAVVGWMRTTAPDCCWFCAMLASRGPVYEEDSFAESDPRFSGPGNHKVHDACGCMMLPMYRRMESDAEKGQLRRYKELNALWAENNSAPAFKKAYEAQRTS